MSTDLFIFTSQCNITEINYSPRKLAYITLHTFSNIAFQNVIWAELPRPRLGNKIIIIRLYKQT